MKKLIPLVKLFILSALTVFGQSPAKVEYADSLSARLEPVRKIVYKTVGGTNLHLHVFLPKNHQASDKRPAFLAIHGGGWSGGGPRRFYSKVAELAEKGIVGFVLEYRLLREGSTTVYDCVKDARSAVRFIRKHAAELGIDPDKIIAGGQSAGAHLAVGTALFDEVNDPTDDRTISTIPNALVLYYPVIDTSPEGYGQKKIGETWQQLSPLHRVRAGMPPTVLLHGTGDQTTPFKGATDFAAAMKKAGNRCDLYVNEGGAHSYFMRDPILYQEAMQQTTAFLSSLGYIDRK